MRKFKISSIALNIILWSLAIALSSYAIYISYINRGYCTVDFLSVGQGDSTLIETSKYTSFLIDGGDKNSGDNVILPYCNDNNIDSLSAIFVSHMHADHMFGVLEILDSGFDVDKIYISEKAAKGVNFKKLEEAAKRQNVDIVSLSGGEKINFDDTEITVLSVGLGSDEENDNSLILRFDYGENSILFSGDAEKDEEKTIVDNPKTDTDILKVGHHGSKTSSSRKYLEKVTPNYAIIEVGEDNKYNLPAQETIEEYERFDIPILRTDKDGTIEFVMTDTDIKRINKSQAR